MQGEAGRQTGGVSGRRVVGVREFVLLAVGFGCMVGFARMASLGFVGYFDRGVLESADTWYGLRAGASLFTLGLLALAGWKRWFAIGTKTLVTALALAIAAAIVFAVDETGATGPFVAVAGGCSAAVLMYAWMLLLGTYDVASIAAATLAGLLVSGAIVMGVPRLDVALALVVAVVAAFVAGAFMLLLDVDLEACAPDGPPQGGDVARVPWLTVTMTLACGFISTVLYGIAEQLTWLYDWTSNQVAFGLAVFATIGTTFALMLRVRSWAHLVWVPSFVLLVLALVFACFSIRESIQIAVGLLLAAVFCAHFLHWAIFPALFSTLRIPRAFLAGVVLVCVNGSLASALGDALGTALPHSVQNLGGVAGITAILLGVVFAVTLAAYRHVFGAVGFLSAGVLGPLSRGELNAAHTGVSVGEGLGSEPFGQPGPASPIVQHSVDGPNEPARPPEIAASAVSATSVLAATDASPEPVAVPPSAALPEGVAAPASPEPANPLVLLESRIETLSAECGLTPRECEVAMLTAQGFSGAYIAERLVVSNSTVRFHQQNIYRKLDVHSRNELIELVSEAQ